MGPWVCAPYFTKLSNEYKQDMTEHLVLTQTAAQLPLVVCVSHTHLGSEISRLKSSATYVGLLFLNLPSWRSRLGTLVALPLLNFDRFA